MFEQTIFTLGHSTRSLSAFIDVLRQHAIQQVIDVRAIPASRYNPQFASQVLSTELTRQSLAYRHLPQVGGRRQPQPDSPNTAWQHPGFRGYADYMQTTDFSAGLSTLLECAASQPPTAILCAEAVPWRCHRQLLADALLVHGYQVQHIMPDGSLRRHQLPAFAVVSDHAITYPAAQTQLPW